MVLEEIVTNLIVVVEENLEIMVQILLWLRHFHLVVEVVQVTITEVKLVNQEVQVVDRHFMLPLVLNVQTETQVVLIL